MPKNKAKNAFCTKGGEKFPSALCRFLLVAINVPRSLWTAPKNFVKIFGDFPSQIPLFVRYRNRRGRYLSPSVLLFSSGTGWFSVLLRRKKRNFLFLHRLEIRYFPIGLGGQIENHLSGRRDGFARPVEVVLHHPFPDQSIPTRIRHPLNLFGHRLNTAFPLLPFRQGARPLCIKLLDHRDVILRDALPKHQLHGGIHRVGQRTDIHIGRAQKWNGLLLQNFSLRITFP